MNETTQPLGEWFTDVADEVCAILPGGAVVVVAQVNPMAELTPAATANHARLIAAAPDLLAALARLWPSNLGGVPGHLADDFIFPCDITAGELRAAQAAIAKAGQLERKAPSPDIVPTSPTPKPRNP